MKKDFRKRPSFVLLICTWIATFSACDTNGDDTPAAASQPTSQPPAPAQKAPETAAAPAKSTDTSKAVAPPQKTGPKTQKAKAKHVNDEQGGAGDCFFHSFKPALNELKWQGKTNWTQQDVRNWVAELLDNIPQDEVLRLLGIVRVGDYASFYKDVNTVDDLKNLIKTSGSYLGDILTITLINKALPNMRVFVVKSVSEKRNFLFNYYEVLEGPIQNDTIFIAIIGGEGHYQAFPVSDETTGEKQYAFQYKNRKQWPTDTKRLFKDLYAKNRKKIQF
ncbi:MAG: hypothetical protein AAF320_01365 [Myxococcota bacterium]